MEDIPGVVTLSDGDWTDAFRRLDAQRGGIVWVPPGVHDCEPTTVDLADYESLGDNFAIRGAGLGASVLDFGTGVGDGFSILDSNGGDMFYTEITGVGFQGARDGVLFRLGNDECTDAYNSCRLSFATNNGSPDGTAACRLNHVLNSRHFGVHNCDGGTALELRQFQFGGITGSVSSREGLSMDFRGYSMANVVEWLNVEACADGVRIVGENSGINRFGMLYGANVHGTLWRHEAPVETRIDAAFLGSNIERVGRSTAGSVSVGLTNGSASAFKRE
ncbi:hypothetical protein [Halorubrum sp. CSM-61]|uniref:hypothetical protein n=1 Tax=Halorubrum sp. CSM-61 TaxID=2485838 RepID=UPI000F4CD3D9|nr:hypothetical protein [Halorubrum sp. CSM-61]